MMMDPHGEASLPAVEEVRTRKAASRGCWIGSIVVVVLCFAVGVALGIVLKDDSSRSRSIDVDLPNIIIDDTHGVSDFDRLVEKLKDYSSEDDLLREGSPQWEAAHWLVEDDASEAHLMIRYVLAVLYFSTGGANWKTDFRWLSRDSACSWTGVVSDDPTNVYSMGVLCDDAEVPWAIYLGESSFSRCHV